MSVETKKRLILRNLLHVNSSADMGRQQRPNSGIYVQVSTDIWPATPRPRTRGTGAALPFQKRVQRAIGHITSGKSTNRPRTNVTTAVYLADTGRTTPPAITLRYRRRSSTAPNGAYSGAELLNYGVDNRKSSSETRNSSSPDDGNDNHVNNSHNRLRRQDNRPSSRNKRRNVPVNSLVPLERSTDSELPSVLDENITGTRLNPPSQHLKGGRVTGRPAVLKPINSSDQLIATSQPPKHKSPLSISGLAKLESSVEDAGGAGWTQTQNAKVPTVTRPPMITSQHQANNNNNSSSATSTSTSSSAQKAESGVALNSLTVTAASSNTYSIPRRPNKQLTNSQYSPSSNSKQAAGKKQAASVTDDTKYADPIAGASPSFQARLSELASLEAETVRYERLRRVKKKSRDKED